MLSQTNNTLHTLYNQSRCNVRWFASEASISSAREFFDDFIIEYGITNPTDWGKVYDDQIKHHGGSNVFSLFGSLENALKSVYPSKYFSFLLSKEMLTGSLNGSKRIFTSHQHIGIQKKIKKSFCKNSK